jgi:hypothetical protein
VNSVDGFTRQRLVYGDDLRRVRYIHFAFSFRASSRMLEVPETETETSGAISNMWLGNGYCTTEEWDITWYEVH